jgi:RNA polymerase sigma-70 factor (ECF subfamily)
VMGEEGEPGEAPCLELTEELRQYVAEEIDQATCARIQEHLQRCPRCGKTCASLQRTVSFCTEIPGDEVPAPVRAAVRAALLAAISRDRAPPDRR